MTADSKSDPLALSLAKLIPRAADLPRWALLTALSRPSPGDRALAAEIVTVEVAVLGIDACDPRLADCVLRAWCDAERAPVIRVDHDAHDALLTSTEHLWRLADCLDEAVLVLGVLASACASALGDRTAMAELLEVLGD